MMKILIRMLMACCCLVCSAADGGSAAPKNANHDEKKVIPWYFIAVHNEPFNHDQHRFFTEESYSILQKMVTKADQYNIKLTIMFAPAWADYIKESKERVAELALWKKNGHELAGHHHSVYHGNWDGYSDLPAAKAQEFRIRMSDRPETFFGTMKDFSVKLKQIDPDIKSGCMNDEGSRDNLPDMVIYDTCSGFANFGEPGKIDIDINPEKGRNEYVTVGTCKGIERKWLTHHFMPVAAPAIQVFSSMRSGVYGIVNHSAPNELQAFSEYLDFLHQVDPQGKMSRTVTQIIEQKMLPEKKISDALVNGEFFPSPPSPYMDAGRLQR